MFQRGLRMTKTRFYDIVHRSLVSVLVGFTAVTSVFLLYKAGHYVIVKRPKQIKEGRIRMEEKISKEQQEKEDELMVKQREAEGQKY